jgi:hypothetical protein
MTTHRPTRWIAFLIALLLVTTACAGLVAPSGTGAGNPPPEASDEEPDLEPGPTVQVIPDCPSRNPGSFC